MPEKIAQTPRWTSSASRFWPSCSRIVRCHSTTGESDYVMSVPDIKSYEQLLHDTMLELPGVTHVRSAIVLEELESELRLALPDFTPPARAARRRGRVCGG